MVSDNEEFVGSLLAVAKERYPVLGTLLNQGLIELNENRITLKFQYAFHLKKMQSESATAALMECLAEMGLEDKEVVVMGMTSQVTESIELPTLEELADLSEDRVFLHHVHISNFRALDDISLELNPKVNVIIGANNAGKSAIIDAIRLAMQVGKYKKSKYVSLEDFRDPSRDICIDLKFFCPDDIKGIPELKVIEKDEQGKKTAYLELHVKYSIAGTEQSPQIRQSFWGGRTGGKVPDDDALDIFSFDFLDALRDAKMVLKPSTKSKIADLLLNLRGDKVDRKKIEAVFEAAQKDPEVVKLVGEANTSVQDHLSKIALKHDRFEIGFHPLPPLFEELVGTFEMKLVVEALLRTVGQNGLGYNNVLYASTVLGHIKSAKVRDRDKYHALIIEEPEAHLHPQLEDSLFSYLSNLGADIGSQVIVTSHSPIISSTTNIDNIIVLHRDDKQINAVNLSKISLEDADKRKISRYLDVTKSQMFFAKSVILVEGITEALLLPVIADSYFGEKGSLISRGVEVVDIDGISFEPYAKLFNNLEYALPAKAVILTDKDSYTDQEGVFHDKSARTEKALELKAHNLDVQITSGRTFEVDLWDAGNDGVMKEAAAKLFPRSSFDTPEDILRLMDNSSVYGKGDLAQEIIEISRDLKVPKYIENALNWIDKSGAD